MVGLLWTLLILVLLFVALIVVLFAVAVIRERKMFYTPDDCSLCHQETGVQGNKRFVFQDGCVCEKCMKKAGYVPKNIGSGIFKNKCLYIVKEKMDPSLFQERMKEMEGRALEYKGFCGGRVAIQGNDVELKFGPLKQTCTLNDIHIVEFTPTHSLQIGSLDIYTKKEMSTGYSLMFFKSRQSEMEELFEYLGHRTKALMRDMSELPAARTSVASAAGIAGIADAEVCCPKCGSMQFSADKKGFGVGKAVVGAYLAGPIGLTAGNIGAKKVRITCLKCGHQWMAGQQ